MNKMQVIILSLATILGLVTLSFVGGTTVQAACDVGSSAKDCLKDGADIKTGSGGTSLNAMIKRVVGVLMFVLGAIAVIMIIIGGIKFTTANGDSGAIKSAKDTILYSVIGLVVAIMAYAIVGWVIDQFTS